jgi:surface protein
MLRKISSPYIFNVILKNIPLWKRFSIVKYNKYLKNRTVYNLQNYLDIYYPVHITIYSDNILYGRYLANYEYDKDYISVFYNNRLQREFKAYTTIKDHVNKIDIFISSDINRMILFDYCHFPKIKICGNNMQIKYIDFSWLFSHCDDLIEINIENINCTDLTTLSHMFEYCTSLKKINLNTIDTKEVTNMSYMFKGCISLEDVNISNFRTDNLNDTSHMFEGCCSLKKLNLNNFISYGKRDMSYMFYMCCQLNELNIDNFVFFGDCNLMFYGLPPDTIDILKAKFEDIPDNAIN